jgi:hypothetical protein
MKRTDSMVVVFSVLRTLLPGDTIRFEGTKAEAEETTIATTARTSGENLFILFTLFVVKYLKNY